MQRTWYDWIRRRPLRDKSRMAVAPRNVLAPLKCNQPEKEVVFNGIIGLTKARYACCTIYPVSEVPVLDHGVSSHELMLNYT